ncbi:MAG: FAD:protein FMN transferase [Saprospiraceae bacterium]|nr:FAD:protein FMN transferase [Saprospiraceae bacterium]
MRYLIIFLLILMHSCNQDVPYSMIEGQTMGTTYHITSKYSDVTELKRQVDSLLLAFNQELSTYISSSTISRFNQSENGIALSKVRSPHFYNMMVRSREIYKMTGGAFDPSIGPLVEFYGFGNEKRDPVNLRDTIQLKEKLNLVGFDKFVFKEINDTFVINKPQSEMTIDFSSIAKGYGVDLVCQLIDQKGIEDYLVEIGGESRAKGVNANGRVWTLGINTPDPAAGLRDFISVVKLNNKSLATSGNYRNFYNVDSITYVHIIDPMTGMSKPSDILSATILADDCATADAIATASIVMETEDAMNLINKIDGVEACFIIAPSGKYDFIYSNNYKAFNNE